MLAKQEEMNESGKGRMLFQEIIKYAAAAAAEKDCHVRIDVGGRKRRTREETARERERRITLQSFADEDVSDENGIYIHSAK